MHLIDEQAISRGMLKVESGEDLVESLQTLAAAAGWKDALITGAGVFELVELLTPGGETLTLENAEITSLAGRIHRGPEGRPVVALRASVVAPGGLKSGRIVAAMTGGLLLSVSAIVDEAIKPKTAPPPTMRAATEAAAAVPAAPAPPSAAAPSSAHLTSQAAAAPAAPAAPPPSSLDGQRSATKPLSQSFTTKPVVRPPPTAGLGLDIDEDEYNPIVNTGDVLIHPQLGRCEVLGDDDSGGTRIRVPSGKTRVLRLDALKVQHGEADEDGKTVFKIVGPRRRAR